MKETSLSTKTPAPSTRHERRLAARAAGAGGITPRGAGSGRRRASPLVWTTVVVGLVGIVIIGALVLLQGGTPQTVDVASLKAPLSDVPADLAADRTLGKPNAPVTLEIWSDFQCPACDQLATIVEPVLVRTYVTPGILRIVVRDAAFQGAKSGASYDESVEAGAAARCAAAQNAYWPFHNWLFANQVGENQGAFRDERLRGIASAVGLDVTAWDACRATGEQQAAVRAETKEALAKGVNATPTSYLNGQAIVGVRSAAEMGQLIEAAAAAAG